MNYDPEDPPRDVSPGPNVTPALFAEWRNARRGASHAQRLTNPVWDWLIRTDLWPYTAGQHFAESSGIPASPRWCFSRYGMSETELPNGRQIFIAGEHEDHYDPDFFIYNDVIVRHPDDSIDVFGYPAEEFPPTDFHSATLVDGRVLLIGCLGYPEQRKAAETPCFSLDPVTMQIARLATSGENPGWIFKHSAELVESGILVRGGQVQRDSIAENCDDWLLDPRTLRWRRLTDRQWRQLSIRRVDRKPSRLWEIRHYLFELQHPQFRQQPPDSEQRFQETCQKFAQAGIVVNGELIDSLYSPPVDHLGCVRKESERFNVYRILIDDVVVRYTEESWSIDITVEGQLPEATLNRLINDVCEKLGRLENTKFVAADR